MIIKTKFIDGDKVWIIDYKIKEMTCKICAGKKIVKIKDAEFECPNCHGSGKTKDKKVWFVDKEMKIDYIRIYTSPLEIRNMNHDYNLAVLDEHCFATRKQAEMDCKRRNKNV